MCQAQRTQGDGRKQGCSYRLSGLHGSQRTNGVRSKIPNSILSRNQGIRPTRKVYTTEVHPVSREVRLEVPREPLQADDGPLEPYECFDVSGVLIMLEEPWTEVV